MNLFERFFQKEKRIIGDVVDLAEEQVWEADSSNDYVPSFFYGIYIHNGRQRIGYCDLRVGHNQEMYYAGNIGYHIYSPYRGNHYAYEACKVLFEIAKEKGMEWVIITCSPDNEASRKTIERLGAEYLETVPVPSDHWLYRRGETIKHIYRRELQGHAV